MDGSFLFHFFFYLLIHILFSGFFFLHAHVILAFTVISYTIYKLYLILMQPHNNKNVFLYENNKTNNLNNHKLYVIFQCWANVRPTLHQHFKIIVVFVYVGPTLAQQ